jgi:hypothetical protein
MAYTKTTWANTPATTSPINSTNLNKIETGIETTTVANETGWNVITGLSYLGADAPTFTITTATDLTGILSVGMKLKLTQTTVKYFIITAITSTVITVYGGTDYTLVNAPITVPYYSMLKAPFGFPLSPAKWSVIITDTTDRSQVTSGTTVYNLGGINIVIPIGLWEVKYQGLFQIGTAASAANAKYMTVSLSTANNTIVSANAISLAGGDIKFTRLYSEKSINNLALASKTTYYLNARDDAGSSNTVYFLNASVGGLTMVISATIVYL